MLINRLGLVAAGFVFALPAFAETYQWEFEGEYSHRDFSGFPEGGKDLYGLSGTYYFEPVQTDGLPLGEAAFLNHASNIRLGISRSDLNSSYQSCQSLTGICDTVALGHQSRVGEVAGEFYSPNGWLYMAGRYSYFSSDDDADPLIIGQGAVTQSSDYWTASLGIMPLEGLRLTASLSEGDSLLNEDWNISAKYVLPLGRQALNLTSTYYEGSGYDNWSVGGDFYFNSHFSVGAEYSDEQSYEIRTEAFFSDTSSISLSYQEHDDDHFEQDGWRVGLKTRF